jgi:hypothetical protein
MGYDARIKELKELIAKQLPRDGGADAAAEEKAMLDALDWWGPARSARMERLANAMNFDGNAYKSWQSEAPGLRSEMRSLFADCLRNVKTPTIAALAVVQGAVLAEEKLCEAFERGEWIGTAFDAIALYNKQLDEKMDALEAKWDWIEDDAENIMRDEQAVLNEIRDVVAAAIERQASLRMNWREKFREWSKAGTDGIDVAGKMTGSVLIDAVNYVLAGLKTSAEAWSAFAADFELRKARYEAYFREDHNSLLIMFADARRDARAFVDEHDYDRLSGNTISKARRSLEELKSAAQTPGQQSDVEAFTKAVLARLEEGEKNARSKWDAFVSENKEKFFGAFTPELEKAVIGTGQLTEAYQKITSLSLHALLARWVDDDRRDWREVESSDLGEKWTGELRQAVEASLEKLAKTQEEIEKNNMPDVITGMLLGPARKLADKFR